MSTFPPGPHSDVEGILFDLDGVLGKLRVLVQSAVQITREFGGTLTEQEFRHDFAAGRVRCLWQYVAQRVINQGITVGVDEVRDCETRLYYGRGGKPGLVMQEELLISRALLERVGKRFPLGVVTSRPKDRVDAFFSQVGIKHSALFAVVVTRDDVGEEFIKPHPRPVELGVARLPRRNGGRVLFLDDSPSGMSAGRGITVTVGVADPEYRSAQALFDAGAEAVLEHPDELGRHLELND